ncbi:MAG: pyridoxamine 5'-phosphate oxidase family protein [Anaerolineae bacterium]|nr:pyridoxamine 5'-phosphate oxidase family protein [Anaerolineae bacterium]
MSTSLEISPELLERIDKTYFAWFTTVRADGMPQPTPVWFIRDLDGTFLIYSQPDAHKVRNLQHNSHVALSFAYDEKALKYIVVMGEASIDVNALPMHLNVEYLAKYGDDIATQLNSTPDRTSRAFSTPIRISPSRIRGD